MVAIPPPYSQKVLEEQQKQADYGFLALLEGTWVNVNPNKETCRYGVHTTCLPSPGTNSEQIPGKFHFLCQSYTEELTFTKVPGGVRNRAGANEQFCGAIKYDTAIKDLDGNLLHEENGMYLWLDDIFNHPADDQSIEEDIGFPELASGDGAKGPVYVPNYSVSRSGVIPHGSTMMMFGKVTEVIPKEGEESLPTPFPSGNAAWNPKWLAISPTMGERPPWTKALPSKAGLLTMAITLASAGSIATTAPARSPSVSQAAICTATSMDSTRSVPGTGSWRSSTCSTRPRALVSTRSNPLVPCSSLS